MLTPEIAKNIMKLLQRVDLKGTEVPAFVEAHNALQAVIDKAERDALNVPGDPPEE